MTLMISAMMACTTLRNSNFASIAPLTVLGAMTTGSASSAKVVTTLTRRTLTAGMIASGEQTPQMMTT